MGWHGLAWHGMAWHDVQIVAGLKHIVDNMFSFNFGMLHARFACSIVHFQFGLGGTNNFFGIAPNCQSSYKSLVFLFWNN